MEMFNSETSTDTSLPKLHIKLITLGTNIFKCFKMVTDQDSSTLNISI